MKLKPCPFCAGIELSVVHAFGESWVGCNKCKASAAMGPDSEAAIKLWNTRKQPKKKKEIK